MTTDDNFAEDRSIYLLRGRPADLGEIGPFTTDTKSMETVDNDWMQLGAIGDLTGR